VSEDMGENEDMGKDIGECAIERMRFPTYGNATLEARENATAIVWSIAVAGGSIESENGRASRALLDALKERGVTLAAKNLSNYLARLEGDYYGLQVIAREAGEQGFGTTKISLVVPIVALPSPPEWAEEWLRQVLAEEGVIDERQEEGQDQGEGGDERDEDERVFDEFDLARATQMFPTPTPLENLLIVHDLVTDLLATFTALTAALDAERAKTASLARIIDSLQDQRRMRL
jgi:hypothetical protein